MTDEVGKKREILSPSLKYRMEITWTKRFEGYWRWSIAHVYNAGSGDFVAVVHRNYDAFWVEWAEGHPDGHDYLICGEDYQGQTVIQLDTGLRRDFIPASAEQGLGFCWIGADADVEEQKLVVTGCIWGAPFERVTYDFSEPMALPYKELSRSWEDDDEQ